MTGEDHNTDALIAALRSPALPAEQAGEAAAVSAMLEGLSLADPAQPSGLRSRRGIAIAAVTVASLGVGGLVAAGPGIFQPAADRPDTTDALEVVPSIEEDTDEQGSDEQGSDEQGDDETSGSPDESSFTGASGDAESSTDGEIECVGDNHGDTVSATAQTAGGEDDDTPGRGDEVREAAHSDCGKDRDDATNDSDKGKSAEAPGQTGATPGQSGDTPGQTGDTPGQTGDTPGQTGDTPGQTGDTPGQTGDAPGKSGEDPGKSDGAPRQSEQPATDSGSSNGQGNGKDKGKGTDG